jgi:hypothetical protein
VQEQDLSTRMVRVEQGLYSNLKVWPFRIQAPCMDLWITVYGKLTCKLS